MLTRSLLMGVSWEECKQDFASDGGLRDVQVIDATLDDWEQVLDFIRSGAAKLDFTIDGKPASLPSQAAEIIASRATASPILLFRWGDIDLATHFFGANDLEFDFRPEHVHSQTQLDHLLSFTARLGRLLGKTILVYHEGWEMSPFLVFDAQTDATTYSPQSI